LPGSRERFMHERTEINCCTQSSPNNGGNYGVASDKVPLSYQELKAIHFCSKWDVEQEQ